MKLRDTLKEFLQKPYESIDSFLKNVIFPVFGEGNFVSAGNGNVLRRYPDLQAIANDSGILSLIQVGYIFIDGQELNIFDIKVNSHRQLSRSRVAIQSLVRKLISTHSSAFMIFHYDTMEGRWDWRFTFCQKGASNADSTDAKRYTFLLGPSQSCRTAADNFMKIYEKIEREGELEIDDIVRAFDVEALSKEFFDKYVHFYKEYFVKYMCDEANGMRQDFITTDFDHTGLTSEQIKDKEEKPIRDYLKKLLGRLVFLQFLQKKGWMGVPVDKEWGDGNYDFLRQLFLHATSEQKDNFLDGVLEPLFTALDTKRTDDIYDTQVPGIGKVKIPYLNGGLFERDSADEPDTKFPAEYFGELLEFFYEYNFTIDENDPNDAEVGVDPEMLGKIFESQLEDNKDKGAFYTPKEIVQYMCKESLIAYLISEAQQGDNQSDDAIEEKVRVLVDNPEAAIDKINSYDITLLQVLNDALVDVKICDPAIGSGAFPMGLLNLLFKCRLTLNEALEIDTHPAELKKDIIQNNIYGVDIEKGAIDIARLRFWLSIVVDLDAPEALPNFDYKFMQGNSLLEQYHGVDLSAIAKEKKAIHGEMQITMFEDDLDCLRQEMRSKVSEYFYVTDHQKKYQLREEIFENVKQQIAAQHINVTFPDDYDISANTDFFLWHTWFADVFNRPSKQGFDIVIGNPPYFKYEGAHKGEIATLRKTDYLKIAFGGKLNAYKLFLALAINYITKKNGIISYIFQNSFMGDLQAANLRKATIEENQPLIIDSFPERDSKKKRVFESVKMSVCILTMKKINTSDTFKVNIWNDRYKSAGILTCFNKNEIEAIDPVSYTIPRIESNHKNLIIKLKKLKMLPLKCYEGELNMTFHKKYFLDQSSYPKILKGASIQRYYITEQMSQGEIEYLNENLYLQENTGEKTSHHNLERIAMQGMTGANDKIRLIMSIVPAGIYLANSCNYIIPNEEYPIKYLLGLLNSKLINWFFRRFSTNSNVNGYEVEQFPISNNIDLNKFKNMIASIVAHILEEKQNDPYADTSNLEQQIDQLVYRLYELTEDEIALIEQAN